MRSGVMQGARFTWQVFRFHSVALVLSTKHHFYDEEWWAQFEWNSHLWCAFFLSLFTSHVKDVLLFFSFLSAHFFILLFSWVSLGDKWIVRIKLYSPSVSWNEPGEEESEKENLLSPSFSLFSPHWGKNSSSLIAFSYAISVNPFMRSKAKASCFYFSQSIVQGAI